MTMLRPLLALVFLFYANPILANPLSHWMHDFAEAGATGKTIHTLEIDNDTLLFTRDDGLYSSGLRYTQSRLRLQDQSVSLLGWRTGQELYSPTDIKLPPELVGPPDRPYAGWLYAGLFRERASSDGTRTRVGVDIGCLGPCAGGEWTQTNFHRVIDQPLPRGWSRQIRTELGVVLYGEHSLTRWKPSDWLDITPSVTARFGNIFTDAGVGLTLRAGRLNLLPHQPTLHAFVHLEGRAIGYNATLQGGYFSNNDPHTVDPKRAVGEATVGVRWQETAWSTTLGITRRSNEIRGLPNDVGSQNYVRLLFSYSP